MGIIYEMYCQTVEEEIPQDNKTEFPEIPKDGENHDSMGKLH